MAIVTAFGSVLYSSGHSRQGFFISLFQATSFFLFIPVMAKYFGVNGVAMVVLIAQFLASIILIIILKRFNIVNFTKKTLLNTFLPGIKVALYVIIASIGLQHIVPLENHTGLILFYCKMISSLILTITISTFAFYLFDKENFIALRNLAWKR